MAGQTALDRPHEPHEQLLVCREIYQAHHPVCPCPQRLMVHHHDNNGHMHVQKMATAGDQEFHRVKDVSFPNIGHLVPSSENSQNQMDQRSLQYV